MKSKFFLILTLVLVLLLASCEYMNQQPVKSSNGKLKVEFHDIPNVLIEGNSIETLDLSVDGPVKVSKKNIFVSKLDQTYFILPDGEYSFNAVAKNSEGEIMTTYSKTIIVRNKETSVLKVEIKSKNNVTICLPSIESQNSSQRIVDGRTSQFKVIVKSGNDFKNGEVLFSTFKAPGSSFNLSLKSNKNYNVHVYSIQTDYNPLPGSTYAATRTFGYGSKSFKVEPGKLKTVDLELNSITSRKTEPDTYIASGTNFEAKVEITFPSTYTLNVGNLSDFSSLKLCYASDTNLIKKIAAAPTGFSTPTIQNNSERPLLYGDKNVYHYWFEAVDNNNVPFLFPTEGASVTVSDYEDVIFVVH